MELPLPLRPTAPLMILPTVPALPLAPPAPVVIDGTVPLGQLMLTPVSDPSEP